MSDTIVNEKNYYLGCRVCRKLLSLTTNSVELADFCSEIDNSYSEAFKFCVDIEDAETSELPQRLCSSCASRLAISYLFKKEASESHEILKSFNEIEASENAIYETEINEEEYIEYESIEELDEDCEDSDKKVYEVITEECDEGNDAVSFLNGILKPNAVEKTKKIPNKSQRSSSQKNSSSSDDNRRHSCNVCSKKFQKRSNLIDHLRLHANVKVYSCEHCERSFVQAGNYKAHLRVHTKEKPFACNICNKSYSQSSSLKIHIRSHTQEKNYICTICDKRFTNASDLSKHKLIHDPVKKFKCSECQRPFTQKVHLRKHIEKHHATVVFEIDSLDNSTSTSRMKDENDSETIIYDNE